MAITNLSSGSRRSWNLPNILTLGRMLAVPFVVACLFWPDTFFMRWLALGIFIIAGITDFLDGYLARAWSQQSALGRMLDPVPPRVREYADQAVSYVQRALGIKLEYDSDTLPVLDHYLRTVPEDQPAALQLVVAT